MAEESVTTLEPRSTTGLDIATSARIIGSRTLINKAGYYALKVINTPNHIVVDNEDDPLDGEGVYLVNLNGITPDLKLDAQNLLKHAIGVLKSGDQETAELFAQDAASRILVRRIRENANWIPEAGEMIKAFIERVVPESGPNKGKPVFRVTSIAPMSIENNTRKMSFDDKELADELLAMGVNTRSLKSEEEESESSEEATSDGAPVVE